jgi:hypothetical protein
MDLRSFHKNKKVEKTQPFTPTGDTPILIFLITLMLLYATKVVKIKN